MISIIVAMDKNRVIGAKNEIPWKLPADLRRFRDITIGHTVIMGRKTYETIGRALPHRINIVVTRQRDFAPAGCVAVDSIEKALAISSEIDEIFFIGGGEIYSQIMPRAERLYVTEIDAEFPGSVFFPEINPFEWRLMERITGKMDEKNPYEHKFVIYERR
jgi:dihydrofolate reductase